jgi:hypothetical protein
MSRPRLASQIFCAAVGITVLSFIFFPPQFLDPLWRKDEGKGTKKKITASKTMRRSLKVEKLLTVEICLSDIQSIRAACAGGCHSIELCCNRLEGGIG